MLCFEVLHALYKRVDTLKCLSIVAACTEARAKAAEEEAERLKKRSFWERLFNR